jgi:hypothetical protein
MPEMRSPGMIDLLRPLTEQEEIQSLAYRLFENEGKPEGRAEEHWAKAEEFIRAQRLAIAGDSEEPTDASSMNPL